MKDQWEQECAALRAEVVALQQQVRALAAQQANAKPLARWRVSKSMRLGLLTVCVLLAAGGVLYGAGAMEALFIDEDGKVGIGTTKPTSALHVAVDKSVRFELGPKQKLSLGGNGAFEVDAPHIFGGRFIVTQDGEVGIGNPTPQNLLHVGSGTSTITKDRVNAVIASKTVDAGIAIAQKDNVNVLLQAAGVGGYIGTTSNHPLVLRTSNADRVSIDKDGKVGIGRTDRKQPWT